VNVTDTTSSRSSVGVEFPDVDALVRGEENPSRLESGRFKPGVRMNAIFC
jgi:hypothetical protein